jgi:pimeloyl-ACP methyl ester carboxylesterase
VAWNPLSAVSTPDSVRSASVSSESSVTSNASISLRENLLAVGDHPGPFGLNVVYTPDHAHKADIVFIHGLGGSSRWTWSKNREPHLFWPLTFLPLEPDLCLSRILTFGYDASFGKSTSVATSVLDFAKDLLFDLKYAKDANLDDLDMGKVPLIFVVHSMGGLIVKEVGVLATAMSSSRRH